MAWIATLEQLFGPGEIENMASFKDPLNMLFPPSMVKDALPVLGGGAALGAAHNFIAGALPSSLTDAHWKRALVALGEGYLAGRLLWSKQRDFANGALGGAGAIAGAELLAMAMDAFRGATKTVAPTAPAPGTSDFVSEFADSTRIEVEDRVGGKELSDSIQVEEEAASMGGWLT